ncbi:hypothetical protein HZS_7994 [Henneguya salminicola]|nr:hypothetical protein HZS_7994 [Henneguya salminicola]
MNNKLNNPDLLKNFDLRKQCDEDELDEIIAIDNKDVDKCEAELWDSDWDSNFLETSEFSRNLKRHLIEQSSSNKPNIP